MSDVMDSVAWRLIGNSQILKGFAFGSQYPSLIVTVAGQGLTADQYLAVFSRLREAWPSFVNAPEARAMPDDPQDAFLAAVEWLITAIQQVQLAADTPVYERGRLIATGPHQARVLLPTTENGLLPLHRVVQIVLELMRPQSRTLDTQDELARLSAALADLQRINAIGLNTPKFVRAALDMGMPCQALTGVYQYGHGKRGRWLDSTFTDETSYIGASLARNKHLAARVLRVAGIPVPDHVLVESLDAALSAAASLGYPVVVKPADRDGNLGVAADLRSAAEVTAAFHRARRHSSLLLVEKHVPGDDCRVLVFQGTVIWAHRRVPAGIVGDGRHSVAELVDDLNADPRRGTGFHAAIRTLPLDEEAVELLQRDGLTPNSVPDKGQFVRLRRASNQRNGGLIEPVLAQMHPDNRLLAVRAAQALRMDIAGVDLLIPDITRSWSETGAAINDVNGQPGTRQMPEDLPTRMLGALVPGDGRIPTVVVFGAAPTMPVARGVEDLLLRGNVVPGCHDAAGVRVNGQMVMQSGVAPYDAGLALSVNRTVGAIVLSINDDSVLRTGLPFPRFDVLVLAGAHILPHCAAPETPQLNPVLNELLNAILPACDGTVLTVDQSGLTLNGFEPASSAQWQHLPADAERFYTAILNAMRTAEARHGLSWEQRSATPEPKVLIPA